ncbi:MAG: hypothetical protein IJ062_08460, partial [Firmicutes bacterium]|nr:hypothetical protein [Bacillota bacterium]
VRPTVKTSFHAASPFLLRIAPPFREQAHSILAQATSASLRFASVRRGENKDIISLGVIFLSLRKSSSPFVRP